MWWFCSCKLKAPCSKASQKRWSVGQDGNTVSTGAWLGSAGTALGKLKLGVGIFYYTSLPQKMLWVPSWSRRSVGDRLGTTKDFFLDFLQKDEPSIQFCFYGSVVTKTRRKRPLRDSEVTIYVLGSPMEGPMSTMPLERCRKKASLFMFTVQ